MKTAAALALCLVATAATSDDEQAQARARLLLQRAVEKVRAGVQPLPTIRPPPEAVAWLPRITTRSAQSEAPQ